MIPQEAIAAAEQAIRKEMESQTYDRHTYTRVALEAAAPFLRAQALEDAAQVLARLPYVSPFGQGRETYERMLAIRRGNTDAWLKARAEEERKP